MNAIPHDDVSDDHGEDTHAFRAPAPSTDDPPVTTDTRIEMQDGAALVVIKRGPRKWWSHHRRCNGR